ncbi:dihydroorotase [Candidatus Methylomirabilis sp.]|uniref:dihydroorotase n=1 Tax=Candidatus Methylomirabilis sp. TaxID=2032687 RepID=UPI002A5D346A|nr:dihydroorotase [Candidatus Methylomirabilis sp.]
MRILIKGGRVIDPANAVDDVLDVLIEDDKIVQLDWNLAGYMLNSTGREKSSRGSKSQTNEIGPIDRMMDATGLVVCPGLIDMHVHLRQPGREDKETIASGTMAAARGGFTAVCCMPNTAPVNDTRSVTEFILDVAKREGAVQVYPVGAITKGLKGEELAEIGELFEAGCVAISDDGRPVMNAELMRRAMEYAAMFDLPVIQHSEDLHLSGRGVAHEGFVSTELGFRGIPSASEAVMVARDILLAELTGAKLHIAHVSAAESVRLIRAAKARGVRVSCEATPHHIALTEEAVRGFSAHAKMNPPLRSETDRQALLEGLRDGTIDVIATDHAPHTVQEKEQEFDLTPFGVIGLETALAVTLTTMVHPGVLSLSEAIAKLSSEPARILKLPKGQIAEGADADLTIFDPNRDWTVEPSAFASKSRNTPFDGWRLKGGAVATLVAGKVVWEA